MTCSRGCKACSRSPTTTRSTSRSKTSCFNDGVTVSMKTPSTRSPSSLNPNSPAGGRRGCRCCVCSGWGLVDVKVVFIHVRRKNKCTDLNRQAPHSEIRQNKKKIKNKTQNIEINHLVYCSSRVAPASLNFVTQDSASSFGTFSFRIDGSFSTRSLD